MHRLPEEILDHLLDSSDSMISIINDEMRYVTVNEPFCRSFNMHKEDLVGKSPSELWGENTYREKIRSNIERSLSGETIKYRAFFDISGSSGKYYDVIYKPFKSPGTNLSYAIIETKNVEYESEISEKLIDGEQKNKYMERYLPFGIFSCDRYGMIVQANDTFYDILEVDEDEREDLNINVLLKSDRRFYEYVISGKTGETAAFGQMRMLTFGGKEIFVRISSHIREDTQYGIIADGTLEDVTREVILERQLHQSQRLETLGTLVSGVAHDFNTILNTISGYSEMTMEEVDKDTPVYEYMVKLRSAVNKATGIINQMMVFSKQLDQHVVALEIDKIIKEAVEFIRSSVPGNVTLKTDYGNIEGLIYADPTQLFRVFLNIMTNALHAMEDEGGIMTISLSESTKDGRSFAEISVGDTGKGINPSIIDRIFDPFFTTRETDKGTGMGLAVSHGIITGIGGEINVESNPGEGSIFTLSLPLKKVKSEKDLVSDENSGTILFAHDNLHLSRTVSIALERMGYNVILLHSKNDTLNIIRRKLTENDMVFLVNKFADREIYDILESKHKEGMRFRVCMIGDKDAPVEKISQYKEGKKYGLITEPITLKDILSHLY